MIEGSNLGITLAIIAGVILLFFIIIFGYCICTNKKHVTNSNLSLMSNYDV